MPIDKGKNAPLVAAHGDKWNYKGTYSKENPEGLYFSQVPSLIRRYINNNLDGLHGNHLKIMYLLIEVKEGNFRLSQKWVLDETGMAKDKYYKARKDLEDMGWITCEDDTIYVNYDYLYDQIFDTRRERQHSESFQKH